MKTVTVSKIRKYLYRRINDYKITLLVNGYKKLYPDAVARYKQIIEKYRSAGGFKANEVVKLISLKKIVEKSAPTSILELGTGLTSVVFCDFARKSKASFTGIDENEYWLENSKRLCEVSEEDKNILFVYAPRIIREENPVGITTYDYAYTRSYDLVFIDGPSTQVNDILRKENYNADIFDIVKTHYPQTIVVDSRKSTVEQIIKRLGDKYDYCTADHWNNDSKFYRINRYNHFSVFTKRALIK